MNKHVLTGGPCSGKTTIINQLSKQGYNTVQEAASILITEELKKSVVPLWKTDFLKFQRKLLLKQLELEYQTSKSSENIFIDRGIIDTIAYCKIYNSIIPKDFYEIAKKNKYDQIFILDLLESYSNNSIRKETKKDALKIQKVLLETYKEFGYKPIIIPRQSISQRTNLIVNKIKIKLNIINKTYTHKEF